MSKNCIAARTANFCLMPPGSSLDDYLLGAPCGTVGGHAHLSTRQLYGHGFERPFPYDPGSSRIARDYAGIEGGLLHEGSIEWLSYPFVLRVLLPRAEAGGHVTLRSLSARFGDYLARAFRQGQPWALSMAAQITGGDLVEELSRDGQGSILRLVVRGEHAGATKPVPVLEYEPPRGVPALAHRRGSPALAKRTLPFSV